MSLVGYWPLNESSGNAIDYAGNNDGTVNGATQGAPGILGETAYDFDGDTDYVEANDIGIMGKSHTILAWVKFDDVSSQQYIYNQKSSKQTMWIDGSVVRSHAIDSGGTLHYGDVNFSPSTNQWYLLGHRFFSDSTEINTIINTEISSDLTSTASRTVQNDPFQISTNSNSAIDGKICEVRAYDHALTQSEVQYLYDVTKEGVQTSGKKTL